MDKRKSFLSDIFNSFFWRIITTAINLVIGIILARYLGAEGRGVYAIVILTIVLLTLISNFGIPNATIYYVGKEKDNIQNIFSTGLIHALISASLVLGGILLIMFNPWSTTLFFSANHSIYLLALAALVPQAIASQIKHFIIGQKKIVLYNRLMTLDVLLLSMSLGLFVIILDYGIQGAILGYVISSFIGLIVNSYFVREYLQAFQLSNIDIPFFKNAFKLGRQFFATGIGGFGIQRVNYLLLEWFHTATSVGLYTVASALPTLFLIIPSQLATILYPWVANTENEKDKVKLTLLTIKVSFYICLLLMIPLSLFIQTIIILLYGIEYKDTYIAALILLIGMLFSGLAGVIVNYLAGIGKPQYGVYLTIINILGLVLFGCIFIPNGNIEGAAIAKTTAEFISIVYLFFVFINHSKVRLKEILIPNRQEISKFKAAIIAVISKKTQIDNK